MEGIVCHVGKDADRKALVNFVSFRIFEVLVQKLRPSISFFLDARKVRRHRHLRLECGRQPGRGHDSGGKQRDFVFSF